LRPLGLSDYPLTSKEIVKDVCYKLDGNHETTLELDSHANTCVLGHDALIIFDYNRPVSIVGYDESHGSKTYQTVSGVVAYDDPQTGRMLHLIINQAIHIPHLDHHLLCPMQCHVNDVTVNSLIAKSVLAGEKLVATYSISM
jgi:hypothetical protein